MQTNTFTEKEFSEFACGNIFIRTKGKLTKGQIIEGHKHNFDHTSLVLSGAIRLTKNGETTECRAPSWVLIEAGVEHQIEVLEEGTVFWCVYAHRNPQGEIVQEYTGWYKGNQ